MDSLPLDKSGDYVLSILFVTLAQDLCHSFQRQKGSLALQRTLTFLGQNNKWCHVSKPPHLPAKLLAVSPHRLRNIFRCHENGEKLNELFFHYIFLIAGLRIRVFFFFFWCRKIRNLCSSWPQSFCKNKYTHHKTWVASRVDNFNLAPLLFNWFISSDSFMV